MKGAEMNRYRILTITLWSVGLLIGVTPSLRAQSTAPAETFDELRTGQKLKQGETIEVTETSGETYKAKIASVSRESLRISRQGIERDLTESQVREIRHRRPDKWYNGMLIGLAAGVGAAVVGVSSECGTHDPECEVIASAVFFPTFAGIGMGAGSAIDFAIRKYDTVYARTGQATNRSLRISPILGKSKAGVRVSFGF
jgi:hypothetical protein